MKIAVVFLIVISLMLPTAALAQSNTSNDVYEVLDLLQKEHVSGVNEQQLSDAAIAAMLEILEDPYTEYFTLEQWIQYNSSVNQNYVGIGVRVGQDDTGFYAVEVFPDSPAEGGGVLKEDYIIAVDDQDVAGITLDDLVDAIIGPAGTEVTITVRRLNQEIDITMKRGQIQIPVITTKWFEEGLGYIQLSGFTEQANREFTKALADMKDKDPQGIIIDLRGNPGGYLNTAILIAMQFIEEGTLMHTRDRDHVTQEIYLEGGSSVDAPVVLLVDHTSASASEVLAGALQDHDLATIIGTQTFGKGSVQHIMNLSSGSVLKITVEEYLTPDLHTVHLTGITPDIEVQGSAAQLITALHTLGMNQMELVVDQRSMTVNGVSVMDRFPYIQEHGKTYVPSRVLTALINGEVEWNGEQQAIDIRKGDVHGSFQTSSPDVKLISGISFIELDHFQQTFSEFEWSADGEQFTMTVQ